MFEIGNSLRETRLRQDFDFPEVEHATKIRGKYLRALEDERFELLPSHTYVKGFLRSYAEYLGLDGQLYVDEYNSRYVIGEDDAPLSTRRVPAARRRKRDRRESNVVLLALTSIGLVTALVIAAWQFGNPKPERVPGLQETVASTTPARAPAAPTAEGVATLEVIAKRGDSFVEVRSGDSIGTEEYKGTLEQDQKQRFTGRKFWLLVQTPKNVVVKLNGNRVPLVSAVKTRGVFVTAKRIVAADPA